MKKIAFIILLFAFIGLSTNAQECLTSGGCSLSGSHQYPTTTYTPTASWTTHGSMNGGNWGLFNVTCGNNYEFTYCSSVGGGSSAWDAELTLFFYPNNNTPQCYSNNQCGSNAPYIKFTAPYTGTVQLLTSVSPCGINTTAPYNTLAWRQAVACTGWAVSPTSNSNTSSAGFSGAFDVTTSAAGACYFSVSSSPSWIHSLTGTNGTPAATTYYNSQTGQPEINTGSTGAAAHVNYVVDANTTCSQRTGTITLYDFCQQAITATYTITQDASPAPTTPNISANGNTTFCSGGSVQLCVSNPCSGCNYTWSPGGMTGQCITVSNTGTYTATANNTCGTSSSSNSIPVTVNSLPPVPSINGTWNGNLFQLCCTPSSGYTYQWYLGGVLIGGATSNCYTPSQNGLYTVKITSNNCSNTSSQYNLTTVGIKEEQASDKFSIHPNPTTGKITLAINKPLLNATITIYNAIGEKVYEDKIMSKGNYSKEIELKEAKGVYSVQLTDGDKQYTQKLIIQ